MDERILKLIGNARILEESKQLWETNLKSTCYLTSRCVKWWIYETAYEHYDVPEKCYSCAKISSAVLVMCLRSDHLNLARVSIRESQSKFDRLTITNFEVCLQWDNGSLMKSGCSSLSINSQWIENTTNWKCVYYPHELNILAQWPALCGALVVSALNFRADMEPRSALLRRTWSHPKDQGERQPSGQLLLCWYHFYTMIRLTDHYFVTLSNSINSVKPILQENLPAPGGLMGHLVPSLCSPSIATLAQNATLLSQV